MYINFIKLALIKHKEQQGSNNKSAPRQQLTSIIGAALVLCAYGIRVMKGKTSLRFVKVLFESRNHCRWMIIYDTKMRHDFHDEKYKFAEYWN